MGIFKFKITHFENSQDFKNFIITITCENKFTAKNLIDQMFNAEKYQYEMLEIEK